MQFIFGKQLSKFWIQSHILIQNKLVNNSRTERIRTEKILITFYGIGLVLIDFVGNPLYFSSVIVIIRDNFKIVITFNDTNSQACVYSFRCENDISNVGGFKKPKVPGPIRLVIVVKTHSFIHFCPRLKLI